MSLLFYGLSICASIAAWDSDKLDKLKNFGPIDSAVQVAAPVSGVVSRADPPLIGTSVFGFRVRPPSPETTLEPQSRS